MYRYKLFLSAALFFLFSSCANEALKGIRINIDTKQISPSDFSNRLINDLKISFQGKGMLLADSSSRADYILTFHSCFEYGNEGDQVTVYERCTDCETGDEISYSETTAVLYSDGYEITCTLKETNGKTLLNQTISDEAADDVKNFNNSSCTTWGHECEGTEVRRGLLSGLNPSAKVSRIVSRAIRKNE